MVIVVIIPEMRGNVLTAFGLWTFHAYVADAWKCADYFWNNMVCCWCVENPEIDESKKVRWSKSWKVWLKLYFCLVCDLGLACIWKCNLLISCPRDVQKREGIGDFCIGSRFPWMVLLNGVIIVWYLYIRYVLNAAICILLNPAICIF